RPASRWSGTRAPHKGRARAKHFATTWEPPGRRGRPRRPGPRGGATQEATTWMKMLPENRRTLARLGMPHGSFPGRTPGDRPRSLERSRAKILDTQLWQQLAVRIETGFRRTRETPAAWAGSRRSPPCGVPGAVRSRARSARTALREWSWDDRR